MAIKAKELIDKLKISFEDLKRDAKKMGIEIKTENSKISDEDKNTIEKTISMLRGGFGDAEKKKSKLGGKVTGKVIKIAKEEAKPKESKEEVKEKEKKKSAVKKVKKTEEKKEPPKEENKKQEKPKTLDVKDGDYTNSPNKPMRFKKVFDVTKEKIEKSVEKPGTKEKQSEVDSKNKKNITKKDTKKVKEEYTRKGKNENQKSQNHKSSKRRDDVQAADVSMPKERGKGKSKKTFEKRVKDRFRDGAPKSKLKSIDDLSLEKEIRHKKKNKPKQVVEEINEKEILPEGTIAITVPITVAGLAEQAEISAGQIIMALMKLGVMATINQILDKDQVEMIGVDMGIDLAVVEEEKKIEEKGIDLHEDADKDLKARAPIITVMGHVDHGKTSLLDAIRNTNVTAGESGGITQHIGAYEVNINNKKIVFLDTPGHEAFTTMRARGAQITDIAVLVVAADDSVKPQTIESISHAKAAGVPIIVAINKMDKPGANPDKVKKDLADNGILVEDWGGTTISVPVSAKTGDGIKDLLEMILLQAEMLELRANPDRLAMGTVIEARLDKAKGPIATLLVTNGTLKNGQSVVAGTCAGKIRVMTNYKGEKIRKALPATPVEILGLSDVPMAGDSFNSVSDDKMAREIANNRKEKMREDVLAKNSSTTLEKLFSQIKDGETKELNLVIKGDVQGSVGAIITSLEKLTTDDVKVKVIHSGVGTITESDVMLAETSGAIIIGFNVRPTTAVTNKATDSDVEIRTYRVIYDIIDDIKDAMRGMLDPEFKEEILGKAEIRETFKVPNLGMVGGAYITEGKVQRNASIRLVRDGILIHEGKISSLRRFKDDVKEVQTGYECGIGIENYNDIKLGDEIECFIMTEIKR